MESMFSNCGSLTSLDLSNFKTSNVVDMRYMFEFGWSLISIDLSSFDNSNVVYRMDNDIIFTFFFFFFF